MSAPDPRRAELMARIRKLLALGGSPNPHEAAAALAKARALMDAHRVSEGDLAMAEIAQACADEWRSKPREPRYRRMLLSLVARIFDCRVLLSAPPRYYGRHPELATYAAVSLLRMLERARVQWGVNAVRVRMSDLDAYAESWAMGAARAAEALLPPKSASFEMALDRYEREHLGNVEVANIGRGASWRNTQAAKDGYRDGSRVSLARPMSGGAPRAQIGAA
jgi:Protein of unknown function (DUF2786)